MFDIAPTELLLCAIVALIVIGPKDLPRALHTLGHWVGKAKGMARHFRSGLDEMIRQSELDEMQKQWAEENARIMREHPMQPELTPAEGVVDAGGVAATDPEAEFDRDQWQATAEGEERPVAGQAGSDVARPEASVPSTPAPTENSIGGAGDGCAGNAPDWAKPSAPSATGGEPPR